MTDGRIALLACAAAALCLTLGTVHARYWDDSLVFALASTQVWTPYFWEQDRVGMLVPLLASPIEHPWYNLLAQVWLTATCGLAVPVLAGLYARPGPVGARAGLAGSIALLWLGPPKVLDNVLHECVYPTALTLGFAALLLLDRPKPGWGRVVAAFLLMAVGCWVYVTLPIGLLPLVLLRAWLRAGWNQPLAVPNDRHLWAAVPAVLSGFTVGLGLMFGLRPDSADYQPIRSEMLLPEYWPAMARMLLETLWDDHKGYRWLLPLAAAFALGLATRAGRTTLPAVLALLLAGLAEFAFVSTREWPMHNYYHPRYYLAAVLYLGPATLLPLAERARVPIGLLGLLLIGGAVYRYGPPSPANARAALEANVGHYTAELIEARADAIGGEYYGVWTTAFHVNLTRYEQGDRRPFPGVAFRCSGWRPVWEAHHPHGMTVAVFTRDADLFQVRRVGRLFGLDDPEYVGRTASFHLYQMTPAPPPDPPR